MTLFGYRQLVARAVEHHVPIGIHLDLTYRCDLRCVHCYLTNREQAELSMAELEPLLDELASLGCLFLLVSGGDPFVRPDVIEILEAMRGRRFDVRILTHAGNITERVARRLAELKISRVGVSVYSHEADVHDAVTGRRGSHARTLRGIGLLRGAGVPVLLKFVVFRDNVGVEQHMARLAEQLDCDWEFSDVIRPASDDHRASTNTEDPHADAENPASSQKPSVAGAADLLELNMDAERRNEVLRCVMSEVGDASPLPRYEPTDVTCLAGHASCYISPAGVVQPCLDWEQKCGDLREQSFGEIWTTSALLGEIRALRRHSFVDCRDCESFSVCRLCPVVARRETGSVTGRAPSACRFVKSWQAALDTK